MASFLKDNDDLLFYFEKWIDWKTLSAITEYGYTSKGGFGSGDEAVQFYREVAEMMGEFVATQVAPHAAEIDRDGIEFNDGEATFPPRIAAIFDQIRELELHGMCLPRELGGLNAPLMLYLIHSELLARADVSVMAHHGFHGGMAMAMLVFSIQEGTTVIDADSREIRETRFQDYISEIARGSAWGCMDITEPDAGSDMGKIRARGEQDANGNWYVTGQKIFITSGHGKYHFVIARTEDTAEPSDSFAGLKGLSMFLVQTYEERVDGTRRRIVTIDRIEEKLGHHGSVTAALSFERAPAHLVGKRGEGFKYMLTLMNNARLGVGFECLGLCEAAYRAALAYAEDRGSMGKKIARHEMIADYLDEMKTDIQGIRALAMYGAFHEEMSHKVSLAQKFKVKDARWAGDAGEHALRSHQAKARRVTPLLKYFGAEKAVEMSRRCIQIHGGNGYTKDYPGEKLLRDALVMPIYEGTSQIQSLMAMKDCLGALIKQPQVFVKRFAEAQWRSLSSRDPNERRVAKLQVLSMSAQQFLATRTAAGKLKALVDKPILEWNRELTKRWDPKKDFALAMLHAERLTRLLTDEAVCELLLEQAKNHPQRRDVLERYLERAEPRCRFLYDEITTTGARILQKIADEDVGIRAAAAE
jgi:3-(methylthio)propanoyl-CoA dehydrogenase